MSAYSMENQSQPLPSHGDPLIQVRGVHKLFDNGCHALKNVSLDIHRGEFLVIIGLSGSGKSTLLRCINRLLEPDAGQVCFGNEDITHIKKKALRTHRRRIGMIFQNFNLIRRRSVLVNVLSGDLAHTETGTSIFGRWTPEQKKRALENLKIVGLDHKADSRADELSGGQQQRVAIARALMQDPEILLADEPVASLDPATSHSVMRYLERVNKDLGKTIVCNLHFLSLVRQYASRVVALKGGEKVFEGGPTSVDENWFRQIYGDDAQEVQIT